MSEPSLALVNAGKNSQSRDLAKLAMAIFEKLKADKHPGVSIVVSFGTDVQVSASHGFARLPSDEPSLPMSEHVRYNLASVSKPLTAALTIRLLLDNKQVSLDSTIYPLLPKDWNVHASRRNITFRQILTHKSGMESAALKYSTVRQEMAKPLDGNAGTYAYKSINYSLQRILAGPLQFPGFQNSLVGDTLGGIFTSSAYVEAMFTAVFAPGGTPEATFENSKYPGLGYVAGNAPGEGQEFTASQLTLGSSGWRLTCAEASRLFRMLHYSEAILPKAWSQKMADENLGYDPDSGSVEGVSYFTKGGHLPAGEADIKSRIVGFANGVMVMVFVNSQAGSALPVIKDEFKKWY